MPKQQLITYFDQFLALEEEEKNALVERTQERKIKRRQFVLQEGDVCRHYNFVVKGCLKMYSVDENGTEHNLQFAAENEWMTDLGSLFSEKPSMLYIEAVEPSLIVRIEKEDLKFFFVNYPKFDRNFRVMTENKYVELQSRLLQNISSSAQERYLQFLANYPHLSNRLPNTQIASYLGITPEFLSKIRKKIAGR
ncbi:MAG: Crp/Fnr family transcriptional regulator [Lewinella sp.]|uniref:Crp/Fnr family transcriptional regulator n=1 Tax=Lewinella sp. TaxID=2004506 RepID=UPI003D6A1799